jgi:glycerol uptake facilitator-like aquaporin
MTARALVAEALGTALLVTAVVGSGIMADRLTDDTALALLANTIATGAGLLVLITVFGPVSGAHFNPVVTLVMALRHTVAPGLALGFVLAQGAGGVLGCVLAHAMFELPLVQMSQTMRTGGGQWLAEAVAAFGLVLTICGTLHARGTVAVTVAAYITAAYWFTASTSFANPAVTLARAFSDTFAGIRLQDVPTFWVAQTVGALLAAYVARWMWPPVPTATSP